MKYTYSTNRDDVGLYCPRCGESNTCIHFLLQNRISHDEAERIRARHALGKLHNPDHDSAIYRDWAYSS